MARLSKAADVTKATDMAFTLFNVIQEPTVRKSWKEASCSTEVAVRETRDAWKRHRRAAWIAPVGGPKAPSLRVVVGE